MSDFVLKMAADFRNPYRNRPDFWDEVTVILAKSTEELIMYIRELSSRSTSFSNCLSHREHFLMEHAWVELVKRMASVGLVTEPVIMTQQEEAKP